MEPEYPAYCATTGAPRACMSSARSIPAQPPLMWQSSSAITWDRVWDNLAEYRRLGAKVTLKYIVSPLNCAPADIDAFVARAKELPGTKLIVDIDYNQPNVDAAVIGAIARLMCGAQDEKIRARFGFTGAFFGNDRQLTQVINAAVQNERLARDSSQRTA
jgi:hypothetical protein